MHCALFGTAVIHISCVSGAGNQLKRGAQEEVFSPTTSKDRYAQNYMNSLNRRSGSQEPRSPE